MEDFRRDCLILVITGLFSFPCFAIEPREVVLLGTFLNNKQIVITRTLSTKRTNEHGVQTYRKFSRSGLRSGKDRLENLKIELWDSSYLLGTCTPDKPGSPTKTPRLIKLNCTLVQSPELTQRAHLQWDKPRGSSLLRLRSWLSGEREVPVKIQFDAIGG